MPFIISTIETVEPTVTSAIPLTAVFVTGFFAATVIGSIAWYNSKRPVGWEDKTEKPDLVPDLES